MRSNYRKIGEYIREVDNRNSNLKVTELRGLSMTKEFRESTSNIVGTDMSVYKVMHKWQFACDFMSPIRVSKLPVVLKMDEKPNLVSPAYPVFEVIDRNKLDPEYLMMWFRRPEFDRYATFKCDSAIRGGYNWDELCDTDIPVPHPDKQRELVKEYNTIINRINLNNQLIQKLEETAQAIYKQWFVDFEFPDENGQPYKSSGGEMGFSGGKELPIGWGLTSLGNVTAIKTGPFGSALLNEQYIHGGTPVITVEHIKNFEITELEYPSVNDADTKRLKAYSLKDGDIIFSRVGSVDLSAIVRPTNEGSLFSSRMLRLRPDKKKVHPILLSYYLRLPDIRRLIKSLAVGSTMPSINTKILENIPFVLYPSRIGELLEKKIKIIDSYISNLHKETFLQLEVKSNLLTKMSKY